jgi:hypothetical protein
MERSDKVTGWGSNLGQTNMSKRRERTEALKWASSFCLRSREMGETVAF